MTSKFDKCLETRPKHIAIVAMGDSSVHYMRRRTINQGVTVVPDEVWGINFVCDWLAADKIFLMDGFEALEKLGWDAWVKRKEKAGVPFLMPFKEKRFKCSIEFPLVEVIEHIKEWRELVNTGCFAIAYAIHIGVKRIDLFGFDFDYKEDRFKDAEGRSYISVMEDTKAATQFWAGVAVGKGIAVNTAPGRFLNTMDGQFYGYPLDRQPKIVGRPMTQQEIDAERLKESV